MYWPRDKDREAAVHTPSSGAVSHFTRWWSNTSMHVPDLCASAAPLGTKCRSKQRYLGEEVSSAPGDLAKQRAGQGAGLTV